MLEIRNLKKIYKTKGGVTVNALDGVSIQFPAKGLVFLLGKSGSGKSTLLNVTGGLDRPDDGEIIIKGRNSKSFSGSDFDSYRNTFIGFVFQEYNILNEFNVEQNISLALQLQGKKNDKEAVEKILEQVDLKGYGKRKPNTLSGGQKQRIAIARALIKNPEIIMADEPTGALDSNTGKQVFDTLKKLSQEKLVIVVSHDRDFAEYYGDRIIELSDGKVISDVTKEYKNPTKLSENIEIINDNTISIKNGKDVSKEEFNELFNLIQKNEGEIILSKGEQQIPLIKQVSHIKNDNQSEVFNETKDIEFEEYDGTKTKFIKSRLPMNRAFKMGASSLKTKPIRMIFTIFLTIVSLTMFGVASTLLFFNEAYCIESGLENSVYDYEAVGKRYDVRHSQKVYDTKTGEVIKQYEDDYVSTMDASFSESEISMLNNNSVNHSFSGLYGKDSNASFSGINSNKDSDYYIFQEYCGFIDDTPEHLSQSGIQILEGYSPTNIEEIAISKYMADGYIARNDTLNTYADILNKTYTLNFYTGRDFLNQSLKITGIYDTGDLPSTFDELKERRVEKLSYELSQYLSRSYHTALYVTKDFYTAYNFVKPDNLYIYTVSAFSHDEYYNYSNDYYLSILASEFADNYEGLFQVYDLDGNEINYKTPTENEIYLSYSEYQNYQNRSIQSLLIRISNMIGAPGYSDAFNSFYSNITNQTKINDAINALYNDFKNQEALTYLEDIYTTYYDTYFYHYYLANKLMGALNEIQEEAKTSEITDFTTIYENCNSYLNLENTTDTFFENNILNPFNENKEFYIKMLYRGYLRNIAEIIVEEYNANSYGEYPESFVKNSYSLVDTFLNDVEALTEEQVKAFVDKAQIYVQPTDSINQMNYDFTYEDDLTKLFNYSYQGSFYIKNYGVRHTLNVLGYVICSGNNQASICSIKYLSTFMEVDETAFITVYSTDYVEDADAKYSYILTKTDYTEAQIKNLLQEMDNCELYMTNPVYQEISFLVEVLNEIKTVFLVVGLVFAVFASLMLFNFISSSISSKVKDIGILRAIGTRGSDLFKIFFSESGIIAAICFVISIIASLITCYFLNKEFAEDIGIKVMSFGPLNMALIIAGSIVIAAIGTFIPVFIASKKPPIDSIRTL